MTGTAYYQPNIIVDSGTSFVLMGEQDRAIFLEHLYQDRAIYCHNDFIADCYCDETTEFPDIKFTIDGQDYFLPNTSYVDQEPDDDRENRCYLLIMESGSSD